MRGSAAFRTGVAPGGALAGPWLRNPLWTRARAVPSLDLRFAENKSLVDATTGSNLVTFTRASSGTFVGSDGLIKTAVTNLLLRSEEFNDASWSSVNTNVTADAIAAPNGTLTADLLTSNTTASNSKRRQQGLTTIASVPYTLTCYFKLANASIPHAGLSLTSGLDASTYVTARWNLSTGANTLGTANGAFTFTSQSITSIGDGWYRCSVTGIISSATDMTIVIYGSPSGTAIGSGLRGAQAVATAVNDPVLYAWGAQLEQSSTVGEYIPTTSTINSAPRFDHKPTTGESLGLLVEEQRTNLLLQSEDFSTSWTTVTATVTTNVATAPDGTTTADSYSGTSTSAVNQSISLTSGVTYTISFYVKSAGLGNDSFRLRIDTTQSSSNFTATSEWQRFSFTATSANTGARVCGILRNLASNNVDILIWGAQLEVGAFPTSYIPTTTATVTRSADVASISGSNFSSWYREDEGTLFGDVLPYTTVGRIFSLNVGSNSERIALTRGPASGGNIAAIVTDNGVAQVSSLLLGTSIFSFTNNRVAFGYKASDFAGSVNGLAPVTQNTGSLPTCTQATLGNGESVGANQINGTIKRLTYWPTRLSNSTLQAVTQ